MLLNADCGKAQIKIQQTAFMLIAITIFFVLAGVFILAFKISDIRESAEALQEENAMLLIAKIANSPEFSCGKAFGSKTNCIDSDKVFMLKEHIGVYEDFWGVSKIEIRIIYPEKENRVCTLQNYPNCNVIELKDDDMDSYEVSTFVSLCRKESSKDGFTDKCDLARIMIGYNEE